MHTTHYKEVPDHWKAPVGPLAVANSAKPSVIMRAATARDTSVNRPPGPPTSWARLLTIGNSSSIAASTSRIFL